MYDVLCVGQTCCDIIFTDLEGFPEQGREVFASHCVIKAGGAANTPMALRRLGVSTLFATAVGDDLPGRSVMDYIKSVGLPTDAIFYEKGLRTSVSSVLSYCGERSFVTCLEDCCYNQLEKVLETYLPQCGHLHTFVSDCLHMPVLDMVKAYGVTLSVDTAWDESIHFDDIIPILKSCDVFFVNEAEACSITGIGDANMALDALSHYAKCVALKLGDRGSIIKTENRHMAVPHARVSRVVDSTGAGDLYAAGFIYGMRHGWDIHRTASFAAACGGCAVTFYGGMDESFCKENLFAYVNNERTVL
jgi:Sugar kinases, ribokinase family